jgi:sulfur carrier protein
MSEMQIQFNGQQHDVQTGTTVAQLLELFQMEPRYVAVEVNLELIPRGRHAEHVLQDGDRLEVVTLVGGG